MSDRFRIGRALHRLLSSQVQILDGLLGVATATVVMRQLAVVLVQVWRGTVLQSPAPCARVRLCAAPAAPCRRRLPASGHA